MVSALNFARFFSEPLYSYAVEHAVKLWQIMSALKGIFSLLLLLK